MHRQKSILSFLQKPSPDNQNSGGSKLNGQQVPHFPVKQLNQTANAAHQPIQPPALSIPSTLDEIRGTDTPPEKVPRRVFPVNCTTIADDNKGPSLFSSIKHKFVKVDGRENSCDRKEMNVGSPYFRSISSEVNDRPILSTKNIVTEHIEKESPLNLYKSVNQGDKGCPISIEIDDDIPGPETPGMRPLIPRLKRVQEDGNNFEGKNDSSLRDPFKRVKFLQDTKLKSEKHEEASEMTTRFEWLDPSKIKDANGRRPSDPLYNKRTLYIPPDALKKMSASQKQYWSVKSQYMDLILFFKVGKFYELYEVDAETGHKELDWKMTFSGVGKCRQVGISEGGIDDAVQKLLARGYKVGRIEQLETSEQAKSRGSTSVIQRKLVQVLTPSTTIEGNIGPDAVRLLAIKEDNMGQENGSTAYGFAFVDCAALKFWVGSVSDDASCSALGALLMQVSPKEIIYEFGGISNEAQKVLKKYSLAGSVASQLTPAQPAIDFIDPSEVRDLIKLKGYFKGSCDIEDDNAFNGVMHNDLALNALGGLISHLSRLMLVDDLRNGDLLPYEVYKGCLRMDGQTLVNLEIFSNNDDGGSSGTLYKYLDNCVTSSGKRLLRSWICHPLNDIEKINFRLNMVEELMSHPEVVLLIAQTLQKLPDLERMLGRIKATFQSSASLLLPLIGKKLLKQRVKVFGSLVKGLRVAMDMLILLQKEGLMISSLSKVVNIPTLSGSDGLDKFLTQFEAAIDSDFPNYQDHDVKDSDSEMLAILTEMFIEKGNQWSQIIHTINCIDVLRSFAVIAKFSSGPMCRPIVLPNSGLTNEFKGPTLKFQGLWHPFALVGDNGGGLPVPNDIHLGEDSDVGGYQARSLLLTGPNMGGKSTLLRATCLAVILAQLGCYVPCKMCVVSLVDIIFTRLGATDHIMTGESTFFIECKETASVLQNATQDSLIILDELGRGTSTFDGYAIAYAVFRHLVEKVNCRLLFATHYHPLTKEFKSHPHVTLQHMACTFKSNSENASQGNRDLVFLYKLAAGACPESYGMQVALMAGIPKSVVESASKAGRVMKKMIGENFRSCERRSEFSTLHEEWLKTILTVSKIDEGSDDVLDTLFCLWHELKCSFK